MSDEAIRTLELDRYQRNMAEQLEKQGHEAVNRGDFVQALSHFYFAYSHLVTIWTKIATDRKKGAYLLICSAQSAIAQSNNTFGVKIFYQAIDEFYAFLRSNPNQADIQQSYYSIAMCYKDIASANLRENLLSDAIKDYQSALHIFKRLEQPNGEMVIDCLIRLGFTFIQAEHYDFAMTIFEDAISRIKSSEGSVRLDHGLLRQLANCYGQLGFLYAAKGHLIKSLENYALRDNILRQITPTERTESNVKKMQFFKSPTSAFELTKGTSNAQIPQSRPCC